MSTRSNSGFNQANSDEYNVSDQARIVCHLEDMFRASSGYSHIETALSHIFLVGDDVFKLKKAVDASYIDLRSQSTRKSCCLNEIRQNRRYAPEIYLGVKSVVPCGASYSLEDCDAPGATDYLVHMRRFPSDALLADRLQAGAVTSVEARKVASKIARFHGGARYEGPLGTSAILEDNIRSVCAILGETLSEEPVHAQFVSIEQDLFAALERKRTLIDARKDLLVWGHGDLHANNICCWCEEFIPFDGIDFSDELSCIDQMNDVAFLIMDLVRYRRKDLAFAVLNQYLEESADYQGLELLPVFAAYRALVRSMVSAREAKWSDSKTYLSVAQYFLHERSAYLVAVGGLSGTGKSTVNKKLVEVFQGVQLRSDVVRKNILNVGSQQDVSEFGYDREMTERTYHRLEELASSVLASGFPVFVDATFRDPSSRQRFAELARSRGVAFLGIWCEVPTEIALARIGSRQGDASDADVDVRRRQQSESVGQISWKILDCSGSIEEVQASAKRMVARILDDVVDGAPDDVQDVGVV